MRELNFVREQWPLTRRPKIVARQSTRFAKVIIRKLRYVIPPETILKLF